MAVRVGKASLPDFSHRFSPKTYTGPQLFTCLALKAFFKTDFRGIVAYLADMPDLCNAIGLSKVPHFTTLQKASKRLMISVVGKRLLEGTIREALGENPTVEKAAVDSTGMESRHTSQYFVRRRSRDENVWQTSHYSTFPKLGVVCDCSNHIILSTLCKRGPTPDVNQLRRTLTPALPRAKIKTLLADAGYDSEMNHEFAREACGIETIIPARAGRPTVSLPKGKYRRQMRLSFDRETYGQRWQVETVFSMIKRNLGSALRSRSYWAQCRELLLLAITHNLTILMAVELFYRAGQSPFYAFGVALAWVGSVMPRIARAILTGYPHHVTQRGNYRQPVFDSDTDRSKYLAPTAKETWPTQETESIRRALSPLKPVKKFLISR